jgi:hypothetical protein
MYGVMKDGMGGRIEENDRGEERTERRGAMHKAEDTDEKEGDRGYMTEDPIERAESIRCWKTFGEEDRWGLRTGRVTENRGVHRETSVAHVTHVGWCSKT